MLPDCTRRAGSYWTKCACPDCARDRARKRAHHYGGLTWRIPQETAWAILAEKIDNGWTSRALGSATNLGPDYFDRHVAQRRRGGEVLLGPVAADAVMRMGLPTEGQVGAETSRRRLRALAAIGHGLNTLASESGIGFSTVAAIRGSRAIRVSALHAQTIATTYHRLHMTVGGDTQAVRQAREKKWPPPLAWADIDDLSESPADWEYRPERQSRRDALLELDAAGSGVSATCRHLKVSREALQMWCSRHDMSALYNRMSERETYDRAHNNQHTAGRAA